MAQLIADRRDVDFVLHEQIGTVDHEVFDEFNKKTIDLIVSEARNLAIKEILPTFKDGDEIGCTLENGEVTTPESFKRAWELFCEGEWLAMCDDPEVGGQGMPRTVGCAALEYMVGANSAFMLYYGMTHGAAKLVEAFGDETEKAVHEKNVLRGMGRHHAPDGIRSRLGCGRADHHGHTQGRRDLRHQRIKDIYLGRRT